MRDRDLVQRRFSTGGRLGNCENSENQENVRRRSHQNPANRLQEQQQQQQQPQTRVRPALVKVGGRLRAVWQSESLGQCENATRGKSGLSRSPVAQSDDDQSISGSVRCLETLSAKGQADSTHSLCTARQPFREVDVQARCEALFLEGESRRQRRDLAGKEKIRLEAELEETTHSRPPVRLAWAQRWAEDKFEMHFEKQRSLEAQRVREASWREQQAMQECYFHPRLISQSPQCRKQLKAQQRLSELATQQRTCVERLDVIDARDARGEAEHRSACHAAARTGALEASKGHVAELLSSEEGRLALLARAREYTSASPSIPCPLAVREASLDVVHVSEAAAAVADLEEQRAVEVRRLRIERLQVIHELIRVDAEARAVAPEGASIRGRRSSATPTRAAAASNQPPSVRASFDDTLLARLACETWCAEAMHAMPADVLPAPVPASEPERIQAASGWTEAPGAGSPREAFGMPLPPAQFCALLPRPMPTAWQDPAS